VKESTLERSVLDEPIQVTTVDVGRVDMGKGIDMGDTVIARTLEVAGADLDVEFPEPLPMPELGADLWVAADQGPAIVMPEPPPMPSLDWAEAAPPMPEVPVIEDDPVSEENV
jgi:hypothetical protein